MLYDAFVSHASEDKDDFVRPLSEALRKNRVEVWFDEFTLVAGMSLRRSIDHGLAKSRFGIVILSPSFFGKSWPEWELNGLVQRHLSGSQNVILPIWYKVNRTDVAEYSPSLADIYAIQSGSGIDSIVEQLLRVIRPEGSALVTARTMLIHDGYEPPVISDDWWLDVIEGAGRQNQRRWCLPVWKMTSNSSTRGEQLAWTVMQHLWQDTAEGLPITQMTRPSDIVNFIEHQPGLLRAALAMPDILLEHAPQLAIRGFGGSMEQPIEGSYLKSIREYYARRLRNDPFGSGLTTDGLCPAVENCFALRHPTFGNYEPASVACGFVQGYGAGLGPVTKAFETIDYLIWFLSNESDWLPSASHAYLLEGMKQWAVWPWWESKDSEYKGEHDGALSRLLTDNLDSKTHRTFTLTTEASSDLKERIEHSRTILSLPESASDLEEIFLEERILESWFVAQERRQAKRRRVRR